MNKGTCVRLIGDDAQIVSGYKVKKDGLWYLINKMPNEWCYVATDYNTGLEAGCGETIRKCIAEIRPVKETYEADKIVKSIMMTLYGMTGMPL